MCRSGDLTFGELSPPILSSELGVKLRHAQRPQDIAGCIELEPCDDLSEHFSSPPRKHVHIVVQIPPTPSSSSTSPERSAKRLRVEDREGPHTPCNATQAALLKEFLRSPPSPDVEIEQRVGGALSRIREKIQF